jgi:hypothetical protein
VLSLVLNSGCSTKKPPTEKIASAESAISLAEDSKAKEFAARELRQAQDNLAKAKAAVEREDYEGAERFAEKAMVDAKLAEAKAQSENARQSTKDMRETIDKFQKELERATK